MSVQKENAEMEPPKKKRHRWAEDDDIELIEIWEQYEPELRKAKRNSHVYNQMAEKTNGKFTAKGVHCKIKNLCSRYRSEKKQIGPSGGSPSSWTHFNRVHRIIGSNAANNNPIRESFSLDNSNLATSSPPPQSSNFTSYEETISPSPYEFSTTFVPLPSPSPTSSSLLPLSTSYVSLPLPSPSSFSEDDSRPSSSKKKEESVRKGHFASSCKANRTRSIAPSIITDFVN